MELSQQEVMAILGEKELRIAAQAKHIATLEARLEQMTRAVQTQARRDKKRLRPASGSDASAGN